MTATYYNARFVKDGVTVTVMVTSYKENYTKQGLKKIPSVLTPADRITDPTDPDYGSQNKSQTIDLGINPERRLTITGYLINDSAFGDNVSGNASLATSAMNKKNLLTNMFMTGGNIGLTYETGGTVTFFKNVIVDKWEFGKLINDSISANSASPYYGVSEGVDGLAEYDVMISCEDSSEYGS